MDTNLPDETQWPDWTARDWQIAWRARQQRHTEELKRAYHEGKADGAKQWKLLYDELQAHAARWKSAVDMMRDALLEVE